MEPEDKPARSRAATDGHALRASSSVVSFFAAVGIVAVLFGDAAIRGDWVVVARWLPVALLVLWLLWIALWRSSIRITRERLIVVNAVRVHEVPWSRIEGFRSGPQIVVELDDGRRLTCWGGPFPPRAGGRNATPMTSAVELLNDQLEVAGSDDAPVISRWDPVALGIGAVLVLLSAVSVPALRP